MDKIILKPKEMTYEVSEEIKSLRTNLQFCGNDKKVILFTSCLSGEGKSTTALNLARSLTELQKKVLLVDADLRKSMMVKEIRKGTASHGLSHFLSGQIKVSECIYMTDTPQLHMMFAGPVPPNPSELLSKPLFGNMLCKCSEIYDYVLVDCAPLGMVIDAAVAAQVCDGCILILESGEISYRFAQNVKLQLEKSQCPILGVVLNKVNRVENGRYYGKKYEKYYGKYYGNHGEKQTS